MNEDTKKQMVISQTDSEIADIIASQPTTFTVRDNKNFNPFELPEECKETDGKTIRYYWVSKDKRMIVKSAYKGWHICNRTNSPHIPDKYFGVHGGVERLGHLLAYMPIQMASDIKKVASDKSNEAVKFYTKDIKERDPRFYEAKLSGTESDTDESVKKTDFVQGRDF